MTYNTTSKRIVGSTQILEDIENYDSDWDTFLKTEGMYMAQFITDSNKAADGYYRKICLDRIGCIVDNYNELKNLDSYGINHNSWTRTSFVYINNYVPYSTQIQDSQGNNYQDGIYDIGYPWQVIKPYRGMRDGWLVRYQTMWDDDYSRKRNIITQNKKWEYAVTDVNSSTSKGSWGKEETSVNVYKSLVLKDTDIVEYESSDEPLVPNYKIFMGLVYKSSGGNNALGFLNSAAYTLSCADKSATDKDFFHKMKFKKPDIINGSSLVFKLYGDKAYVERVKDTIGKNVFFSNGNNFASCDVQTTYINETNEEVKSVFESEYNKSLANSNKYVYNNKILKDYYWSWEYEISIVLYINYMDIKNDSVELMAQPIINSNYIVHYTKSLRDSIVNCLNSGYDAYKNGGTMREEELEPDTNYNKYISYCNNSDIDTANGAMQFLRYAVSEITPWVIGRAKALYNATTNEKNAYALVNALKTRYNKSTGSFLQCYGSLLSLDPEYNRLTMKRDSIDTSGLLVSRAKTDSADSKAFINQEINPSYIDVNNIDTRFYKSANKFKAGDTVYIIGDGCVEFKAVLQRVGTIGLTVSDFENAEQKEDGSVENILTNTEYYTRLYLDRSLPDYYCKNAKTSNIRVMKLI